MTDVNVDIDTMTIKCSNCGHDLEVDPTIDFPLSVNCCENPNYEISDIQLSTL